MIAARHFRPLVLLGLYAALVVWCTWPLGAHPATHLPDTDEVSRFDLRQMIWALAWQTHALTTDPSRFFEANVYHPTPHALLYADAGYGALPFFLPTMAVTGNHILAANVLFLGCLALTVWGIHLLVAHWTAMELAGFVAAGTLLTSRWLMSRWVPVAPNYAVLLYYPPIMWLGACLELSRRRCALLVVLIVLQGLASPYLGVPVVATLAVLAAWRVMHARTRRSGRRVLAALMGASLLLTLAYAPNLIWLRMLEPGIAVQSWWRQVRYIDVLDLPFGWFVNGRSPLTLAVPVLILIVAGGALRSVRPQQEIDSTAMAWAQGWLWLSVGMVLMVTPWLTVFGHPVTLPFAALAERLPGFDLLRSTHRLGVGGLFGLALLAGAAFADLARRLPDTASPLRRSTTTAVLALGIIGASGQRWADMARFWPAPTAPADVLATLPPEVARAMVKSLAAQAAKRKWDAVGPWVEFPITDASLPASPVRDALRGLHVSLLHIEYTDGKPYRIDAQTMFETIGDWYPVLNGYGGFYPKGYPARMRLAQRLPDAGTLANLRRATGVEAILVRGQPDDPKMARWEALANRGGGEGLLLVAQDGDDLLFRVIVQYPTSR